MPAGAGWEPETGDPSSPLADIHSLKKVESGRKDDIFLPGNAIFKHVLSRFLTGKKKIPFTARFPQPHLQVRRRMYVYNIYGKRLFQYLEKISFTSNKPYTDRNSCSSESGFPPTGHRRTGGPGPTSVPFPTQKLWGMEPHPTWPGPALQCIRKALPEAGTPGSPGGCWAWEENPECTGTWMARRSASTCPCVLSTGEK